MIEGLRHLLAHHSALSCACRHLLYRIGVSQVICYALSASDDSVWRRKIESESEHFCDVSGLQVMMEDKWKRLHNSITNYCALRTGDRFS